jgi:RNase P subunit RPR2
MTGAPESAELTQKTILHLHAAAYSLLPTSQQLSSHLACSLISTAIENDINLPQSYVDTRLCQRCGTIYRLGETCTVRTLQSRRQRRKAQSMTWLVYDCKVCKGTFRTEVSVPLASKNIGRPEMTQSEAPKLVAQSGRAARRKRERIQGLKAAIEKSKAEKSMTQLDLQDLMRVD